jgi:hypothetical protein
MPRLPHQQAGFIILNPSFFLCMPAVPGGSVTFAAQGLEPAAEKMFVPGKPVTNESVEVDSAQDKNPSIVSCFQEDDVPTHMRLAWVLSQQGDPNGAIEEYHADLASCGFKFVAVVKAAMAPEELC